MFRTSKMACIDLKFKGCCFYKRLNTFLTTHNFFEVIISIKATRNLTTNVLILIIFFFFFAPRLSRNSCCLSLSDKDKEWQYEFLAGTGVSQGLTHLRWYFYSFLPFYFIQPPASLFFLSPVSIFLLSVVFWWIINKTTERRKISPVVAARLDTFGVLNGINHLNYLILFILC